MQLNCYIIQYECKLMYSYSVITKNEDTKSPLLFINILVSHVIDQLVSALSHHRTYRSIIILLLHVSIF